MQAAWMEAARLQGDGAGKGKGLAAALLLPLAPASSAVGRSVFRGLLEHGQVLGKTGDEGSKFQSTRLGGCLGCRLDMRKEL